MHCRYFYSVLGELVITGMVCRHIIESETDNQTEYVRILLHCSAKLVISVTWLSFYKVIVILHSERYVLELLAWSQGLGGSKHFLF
jgi:hypothetical protein